MVVGENKSCAFYEYIRNVTQDATTVDVLTNSSNYFYVCEVKDNKVTNCYQISFS
jgi:hypothetical protein